MVFWVGIDLLYSNAKSNAQCINMGNFMQTTNLLGTPEKKNLYVPEMLHIV